jgi:Hg(II)-responsive transcriptional regulator
MWISSTIRRFEDSLNSVPDPRVKGHFSVKASTTASETLTIGRLARAADVGVETIRYYQERKLLPVPPSSGAFRYYPASLIERIRFIKRAQELGFALDEVAELLRLEEGVDRASIRHIATDRLAQIEQKLGDLRRMQKVLRHLVTECEHTGAELPCPIIGTLAAARREGG